MHAHLYESECICYTAGNSTCLLQGTLQLANLVGMKCNLKSINDLRTASLLHDIGHGPFSHVFKTTMKWINGDDFNHEKVTEHLIKYEKEINKILKRKVKIY